MSDVWFLTNTADTKYLDEIVINDEIITLPKLRGYGNIPDLHQSMAIDPGGKLQTVVERFLDSDPVTAKTMIWDIIFAWTGVSDVDSASRGPDVDAQKLAAMEKLTGQDWHSVWCWGELTSNPHAKDAPNLAKWFADWEQKITSYFMLSTHYSSLYELACKAQHEVENGSSAEEALTPLITVLRELYDNGNETDKKKLADVLSMLGAYDSKGRA